MFVTWERTREEGHCIATDCKPSPGARQLGSGRGSQDGNTVNARKFHILSYYELISRKSEKLKGKLTLPSVILAGTG
jgi:hypothetical protein